MPVLLTMTWGLKDVGSTEDLMNDAVELHYGKLMS